MKRTRTSPLAGALLAAFLATPGGLHGQLRPLQSNPDTPITIPRLPGEIVLDGVVDEPAWDELAPFEMTMYQPNFGGALTERTEVWVAHDDSYLYVAGRMWDSDPDGIRTGTFYRDQYSGDDILSVIIDSYNDYETAVWFTVNPSGVRQDRTVSNDAEFTNGMPMSWDWNSYWDVVTTQTEEGWFAEFRIPFSTLGFQVTGDEVEMGLILYRAVARKNERQTFPPIEPRWGRLGFAKPSRAQRVVLRDVQQSAPVYLTPFALGGFKQNPVLAEPPEVPTAQWRSERDPTTELGLDLKYSPTSNLALDVTLNTDFAQVEADDQQINLTRFALFFPEKRQFFQERASTFDFNTGGMFNRLFHSRRIGLDQGEIVRIYGGARAVGRWAGTDFGFLNMQTAPHHGVSSENVGVFRLRQQVIDDFSSVGGMLTTRLGSSGRNNTAYGLDAVIRWLGYEYLIVQWAHTFDEAAEQAGGLESGLGRVRLERRRDEGFSYYAEGIRVGEDYVPGLGFQLRKDFTYGGAQLRYRQMRDDSSPLLARALQISTAQYFRNADQSAESREIKPELEFDFRDGSNLTVGTLSSFESVRAAFPISDVVIPAGEYWFHELTSTLRFPRSDLLRGDFEASVGSFYDGTRVRLSLGPVWVVSKYLELEAGYEVNRLDFADRGVATTAQLASLRVKTALNPKVSMSTFGQYNGATDQTSLNIRFRYHFREGTDLWIVYNEGFNNVRDDGLGPRRPLSSGRALLVKYSHTLAR
ncbi:MAG: carbohydrate binding family 9 domain-containing protein [Gemmatimonadetes bacterium]|nr:carbohydrate binding family 9 domain-containing protein [Gemmatimonadota bacterium]MYC91096.1 carbohydrate binding family 9 domain-containing protein [Gemmatimonadota bacterium]MYG36422.1 carbohydrate binding family 9 domain-containing protein [Gemmatimonadota bacterium]MYJ18340.1 carbohydrate binding family 9 domain-containing protein [Gemmatimonadota bacterium]